MTDLSALHQVLLAPGDLELGKVARLFTTAFDADGSVVFVVDPTGRELHVGAAEPSSDVAESTLTIPVGYGVTGLIALNGRAVSLVDDSPRNSARRRLLRLGPDQTVSRMCLPARGLAAAIGAVLSVYRHRPVPFSEADLASAQQLADLVGLRLHAQRLLDASEDHQSERDGLIAQAVSAQEAERRRIAGDLHDGVTQALVSLTFHLSAAEVGLAAVSETDTGAAGARGEIKSARRLAGSRVRRDPGRDLRPAQSDPRRPRARRGPEVPGQDGATAGHRVPYRRRGSPRRRA